MCSDVMLRPKLHKMKYHGRVPYNLPVISSLGGAGAGRLRLMETLDCFTLVSLSSLFMDSEFWTLGGLEGGTF